MKTYKIIIVSTDESFLKWRTLGRKLLEINRSLFAIKNGNFFIETVFRSGLKPEVDSTGHITHDWMDSISGPLREQGYDFVVFHCSNKQSDDFGIKPSLNGAAQKDTDLIGEAYVMCNEHDKRGGFDKFVQVVLHELRHVLKRGTRKNDNTHALHGKRGDIRGYFYDIDMLDYDPLWYNLKAQVGILQRVVVLLSKLFSMKTLYQVALESLNTDVSPKDRAADVVGCAESVSEVIRKVLPDFPIILGTWTLNEKLKEDPRFKAVTIPMPGDIIMCPTGMGNGKFPGHVGIVLAGGKIASSTSANGKFEQNYTLETWEKRWEVAGGFPIYYYSLIK